MTEQVLWQFGVGGGVIGLGFFVQAIAIVLARLLFRHEYGQQSVGGIFVDTFRTVFIALFLLAAHMVSIGLWALTFLKTGVNGTCEEAIYFALTSYTTLGFGDIVPISDWRLLAGLAAAHGLLQFSLSAAVLIDATIRLRSRSG